MPRSFALVAVFSVGTLAGVALAGSIGSYSGCKSLKGGARSACEKCVAGGNFYQPGGGCGMAEGMHKSKAAAVEKPPPRPKAMPRTAKDYVRIEPGSFEIGARELDSSSDKNDRELFDATVTITRPFMMKATEVTYGEWYFVVGSLPPLYEKAFGFEVPVGGVSWREAALYLNELSKKEKLETCYTFKDGLVQWPKGLDCTGYRLPTEAEWEYAARGGVEEPRYGATDDIAWYYENSDGVPHPVGKKEKNAYGLYDMLGNVWEWVWDVEDYKPYDGEMVDPIIGGLELGSAGQDREMRGGSYREREYEVRATRRFQYPANSGSVHHGFRPVRTVAAK